MVHRPNVGIPHVSPHVVPRSSPAGGPAGPAIIGPAIAADEEKTAVDSSWEDEQSTIDQAEMADKVRRALAEKRRAATGAAVAASSSASPAAAQKGPTSDSVSESLPTPFIGLPVPTPFNGGLPMPAPFTGGSGSSGAGAAIVTPFTGSSGASSTGSTTGTGTATGGLSVDEPTVEDRARPGLEAAALGIARLLVEVGPDAGKDYQLRAGKPVLVGRAIDNTVVLTDLSVSRKHLEINWDGNHWVLADRGSGNGTLLNGKLEEGSFRLYNGDRIEIGHTTFLFEQQGQPGRGAWSDDEPSTIAGRRTSGSGSRPSALQTSELAAPQPGESIVPLERKPLPLPRAAGSAAPFSAPPTAAPPPSQPLPFQIPSLPTAPTPALPPASLLGSAPNLAPPGPGGNLGAPGLGGLSNAAALNASGLSLARAVTAPPRSSPMNTLPGRPPIIGPTAPPAIGDGLVPPRQVAVPADMIPVMQTVPQPRALAGQPPIGRAPLASNQLERPRVQRPVAMDHMIADSGVAVSPPRFPNPQQRAFDDEVPRLTSRTKTAVALVGGGVVLLVAVIALVMTTGDSGLPAVDTTGGSAAPPVAPPPAPEGTNAVAGDGSADGSANGSANGSTNGSTNGSAGGAGSASAATITPIEVPVAKSPEQLAAEKALADKALADKALADKALADKALADKAALEEAANAAAAEKAAADKAAKAAAEKAARIAAEKAAAEKAAAEKAARIAAERAARIAAEKAAAEKAQKNKNAGKRVATVERDPAPASELDADAILARAEELYRKKSFSSAAAVIRDAIRGRTSGVEDLRATAQIYDALNRTYSAGTAAGAKPTDAYTNLRSALRYDEKLGKAYTEDIAPRITALAPRAAAQFLASKQYEEAFQALRDAERAGASSSTLQAVRTAVDAHANELYNQAQSKREDDPAAARSLLRKVLKLVEPSSPLYAKTNKALAELPAK